MTLAEYKTEQIKLYKEYNKDIEALKKIYALENNPYKIGDIVQDHSTKIIIETSRVYMTDPPQMVYTGVWLKKDGTPNKKGEKADIYQQNIIK